MLGSFEEPQFTVQPKGSLNSPSADSDLEEVLHVGNLNLYKIAGGQIRLIDDALYGLPLGAHTIENGPLFVWQT